MQKLAPALLLLSLTACDFSGGSMPIDAAKFLQGVDGPKVPSVRDTQQDAAIKAEKDGNFAGAAQIYQQLLETNPDDTQLQVALSDSLRRGGQYDKAISNYDTILAKDPANLGAKEGKALAYLSKGDFETPTPLFQDVMRADAKRWKTLNGLGILFVTRGLYPESQKYFDAALRYSPNNPSIMNNLGLSQALGKQFNEAVSTLQSASAQTSIGSSDRKRIDLNLSLVYAAAGRVEDARKVAEVYFTGPQLNNNLGLYSHLAKDDTMAKSYLNMALTESKTYYAKAWENLDAINNDKSDKFKAASSLKAPAPAPELKKTETRKSKKEKKAELKAEKIPTVTAVPVAPVTSTSTQTLGTIKAPDQPAAIIAPAAPVVIAPPTPAVIAPSPEAPAIITPPEAPKQ